tara:strand:- start:1592 stop:1858 length:267 start_codon:yes stop_codon:yes gene_type:complete
MGEKIKKLKEAMDDLIGEIETMKIIKEKAKKGKIETMEKHIKKLLGYSSYELLTGYGIGLLKDGLRDLMEIVIIQNEKIINLEKKLEK